MSYQGNTLITMTTASTVTRGELVSGAGTLSATLKAVGVCYDIDGTDCVVAISGTALVELAGTISAGTQIVSDANGKAIAHTTGSSTVDGDDDLVCGVLLEGGVSGDLVNCKIL